MQHSCRLHPGTGFSGRNPAARGPASLPIVAPISFARQSAAVCRWELASFFRRPVSYLLLLAAVLVAACAFTWLIALLARGGLVLRQADDPIRQFLGPNIFLIAACALFTPVLTMNLIADERRRASWECLVTSPASLGQVVVGKFMAAWALLLLCLSPWIVFVLVLRTWNGGTRWLWDTIPWFEAGGLAFDLGPVLAGIVGIGTIAGTLVAFGLLCSSGCRRPVSAALLTSLLMGASVLLALVPRLLEHWQFAPALVERAQWLSCWGQLEWFSRGTLLPRAMLGHLLLWIGVLWLSARIARRVDQA